MTDILGSFEVRQVARTGGTAGLPERVVRAPQLQSVAHSVPRGAFAHLVAVRRGRRNAGRRASSTTDCTPIRPTHQSLAPDLINGATLFLLDEPENVVAGISRRAPPLPALRIPAWQPRSPGARTSGPCRSSSSATRL